MTDHNEFSHTHTLNSSNSVHSSFKTHPESKSFLPSPKLPPGALPWPPHWSPCFILALLQPVLPLQPERACLQLCKRSCDRRGPRGVWGAARRLQGGGSLGEIGGFSRALPRGSHLPSPHRGVAPDKARERAVSGHGVCYGPVHFVAPRDFALCLESPWLRM